MSGALIVGALGAGIGYAVSGGAMLATMIGWTIGSAIGSSLDRPEQPRLGDLKVQSSEYGRPLAITYGTIALQGCVIWASDIIEVEGDSGGKGGGEPTPNRYFGNFAIAICEGEVELGRIWAGPDKRLVYDGTVLEGEDSGAQLRFYSGSETQEPDPLIESYLGTGNVPAYRGTAYVVFENFPLEKDGNRLPFLMIEVGKTTPAPENLGQWGAQTALWFNGVFVVPYHGSYRGFIIRNQSDYSLVDNFTYGLSDWEPTLNYWVADPDRYRIIRHQGLSSFTVYELTGGAVTHYVITVPPGADADPMSVTRGIAYHGGYYVVAARETGGPRVTLYLINPDTLECDFAYSGDLPSGVFEGPLLAPADAAASYVYAVAADTPTKIYKLPLASNFSPVDMGACVQSPNYVAVDPYTGLVWSVALDLQSTLRVAANDPATNTQVYAASLPTNLFELSTTPLTFVPEDVAAGLPTRVIVMGQIWLATDTVHILRGDAPFGYADPAQQGDQTLGYAGTAEADVLSYNPTRDELVAFRDGGLYNTSASSDHTGWYLLEGLTAHSASTRYMGERDIRVEGESLASVIADLSERAGLDASEYDVTDLAGDTVDGYAITDQTDVRSAVMALAPVYYFDPVESGTLVKFVKRGGASVVEISEDDLGASEAGSQPTDPLEIQRIMDEELPRVVTVRYLLEATEYDRAAKSARRLIGSSQSETAMDVPLVLTDTKAMQVAEVNLHTPWVNRLSYRFSLPRKYAYLEPTDVVAVRGITVRIVSINLQGGRFQVEAVHEDVDVYEPNVMVTETPPPSPGGGGSGGGGVVNPTTDVVLELM